MCGVPECARVTDRATAAEAGLLTLLTQRAPATERAGVP